MIRVYYIATGNICDWEGWRTKITLTVLTEPNIPFSVVLSVRPLDGPPPDVPVGVPLDLSTVMEWHELPKYNGIQVSQLIYPTTCIYLDALVVCLENNFHLLPNDTRTFL